MLFTRRIMVSHNIHAWIQSSKDGTVQVHIPDGRLRALCDRPTAATVTETMVHTVVTHGSPSAMALETPKTDSFGHMLF